MYDANKSCEAELRAKEGAAAAEAASLGAAAAAGVASESAAKAATIVSTAEQKLNGPIEELAGSAALLDSTEEATDGAAADAAADASAEAPAVQMSDLDAQAAKQMHDLWQRIEKSYVRGAKIAFSGLRRLRQGCEQRMADAQRIFAEHLLRPCGSQLEVTKFQVEYNSIDLDMINVPEVQAELALQVRTKMSCFGCFGWRLALWDRLVVVW